jgi:hypothetical protein
LHAPVARNGHHARGRNVSTVLLAFVLLLTGGAGTAAWMVRRRPRTDAH